MDNSAYKPATNKTLADVNQANHDAFEESKHPREKSGEFSSGGKSTAESIDPFWKHRLANKENVVKQEKQDQKERSKFVKRVGQLQALGKSPQVAHKELQSFPNENEKQHIERIMKESKKSKEQAEEIVFKHHRLGG